MSEKIDELFYLKFKKLTRKNTIPNIFWHIIVCSYTWSEDFKKIYMPHYYDKSIRWILTFSNYYFEILLPVVIIDFLVELILFCNKKYSIKINLSSWFLCFLKIFILKSDSRICEKNGEQNNSSLNSKMSERKFLEFSLLSWPKNQNICLSFFEIFSSLVYSIMFAIICEF